MSALMGANLMHCGWMDEKSITFSQIASCLSYVRIEKHRDRVPIGVESRGKVKCSNPG